MVCLQVLFIFQLFRFVLRDEFLLLAFRQITPLLPDNLAHFPQLQIRIGHFNRIPNLPRVSHIRHQRLFRSLRGLNDLGLSSGRRLPQLLRSKGRIAVGAVHERAGVVLLAAVRTGTGRAQSLRRRCRYRYVLFVVGRERHFGFQLLRDARKPC